MSASSATTFPVKSQAFRLSGVIRSGSTGNPLTGGLTVLAATVSKDGAAFSATTNAPTEIGTTGFFTLDLSSTEMNANTVIVNVTASNSGAIYDPVCIVPLTLTEVAGAWDAQAVKLFEQVILQTAAYSLNEVDIGDSTGTMTVKKRDGSNWLTGSATDDGTTTAKPKFA